MSVTIDNIKPSNFMADFSDRRTSPRIRSRVDCNFIQLSGPKRTISGKTINISEHGLLALFNEPLPILESYNIILSLPCPYNEISLKGRVMWAQLENDNFCRGIQFYDSPAQDTLREYLRNTTTPENVVGRRKERTDRRTNDIYSDKNQKILPVNIIGSGFYVPEKVITNKDYEEKYGIDSAWISKATGVEERHFADPSQSASDLAAIAAKRALKSGGISPDELDLIILVSTGGDFVSPPTSCIVQKLLNARNASAFDLNAACMGSIWGINTAANYIANNVFKTVLVVAADLSSRYCDFNDKNTFILLGDGAGAVVLTKNPFKDGRGILASYSCAKGSNWDMAVSLGGTSRYPASHATIASGMHKFHMNGLEIYKFAVDIIPYCIDKVIEKAGLTRDDIKLIIPHQANLRILESAQKRSGFPKEKFFYNVQKYANTGGATIAIALADALEQKLVKKDDIVIFVGFGAGLAWGATVMKI